MQRKDISLIYLIEPGRYTCLSVFSYVSSPEKKIVVKVRYIVVSDFVTFRFHMNWMSCEDRVYMKQTSLSKCYSHLLVRFKSVLYG